MKKFIVVVSLLVIAVLHIAGQRTQTGVYYEDGTIITADGHIWGYDADIKNGAHVIVQFDTQYTKSVIDDSIQAVTER